MDCRRYRILVVALLAGCAGCWRSDGGNVFRPTTPTPPPPTVGRPQPLNSDPIETETRTRLLPFKSDKKRKPNPNTYVKWAEVRETAAAANDDARVKQAYWDEARKGYQEALKIDADFAPALTGLGRVYSLLGEQERATSTFNAALQKAPKNAHLWYEFGMSQARFKSWSQAIQCFHSAVNFDPENRHYRKWLGLCLTRAGRIDDGVHVLTSVMGAKLAHYNVAGMLAEMGQVEQSRQQLQVALNQDPDFARARELLAELPETQSQAVQPVVHFEPAPELPSP